MTIIVIAVAAVAGFMLYKKGGLKLGWNDNTRYNRPKPKTITKKAKKDEKEKQWCNWFQTSQIWDSINIHYDNSANCLLRMQHDWSMLLDE